MAQPPLSPSTFSPFNSSLAELNTLGSLPPNTYFHRNRAGHFIPTGDFVANVAGAQSVANLCKGRDPTGVTEEIAAFAQQLNDQINSSIKKALEKGDQVLSRRTFREVIFVSQRIHHAINGRTEGGGLAGVPQTYAKFDGAKETLEKAISGMKENAFSALKKLREKLPEKEILGDEQLRALTSYSFDPEEAPLCPEEQYTDEEWENAIAQSADLLRESVSMTQYYGRYTTGLFYNQMRSCVSTLSNEANGAWHWMDKIGHFEKGDLYLSALPVISRGMNSLEDMKKFGIGAVLSVTEVFESQSEGYFTSPIKPEDYARNHIKHLQIPTPDCETIFFELLLRGVEFVHWCLAKGISVDVHCKAGRGRSFMIVICYLIKYRNMTAKAAMEHVRAMRKQAGFSTDRAEMNTIRTFEKFYYQPSKN